MSKDTLVSVCIITYNHEEFIAECLDSAINQLTGFPFEIVIGEDKSTDKTLEICRGYAEKYPNLIRLITREENLGMNRNWVETIRACKGKYIALCEGDDFWSDNRKLQKQFDALEKEKECTLCCHANYVLNKQKQTVKKGPGRGVYTIRDYIYDPFFHTSSFFFRNIIDDHFFPSWYLKVFAADHFLTLLLSKRGNIYYIDEPMSVYRMNSESISNKWNIVRVKNSYFTHIDAFDRESDHIYTKDITVSKQRWELISGYLERPYFSRVAFYFKKLPFLLRNRKYLSLGLTFRYLAPVSHRKGKPK